MPDRSGQSASVPEADILFGRTDSGQAPKEGSSPSCPEFEFDLDLMAEAASANPKRRLFSGYELRLDSLNGPLLVEKGFILDGRQRQYEPLRHPPASRIVLPKDLQPRLTDAEARGEVLKFCAELRRHLGESGLNLFFDAQRQTESKSFSRWNPTWKFSLPDAPKNWRRERLAVGTGAWSVGARIDDPSVIPAVIFEQIEGEIERELDKTGLDKNDFDNFDQINRLAQGILRRKNRSQDDPYRIWYGMAIQAERDDIISKSLAVRFLGGSPLAIEAPAAFPVPERHRAVVRPAVDQEPLTQEKIIADALPVIRTLLSAYRILYQDNPKMLVKEVTKAALTKLNEDYVRQGLLSGGDKETMAAQAETMIRAVQREIKG